MPRVCELGFTNILKVIFDFHVVNINEARYEGVRQNFCSCKFVHNCVCNKTEISKVE